jgi:tetratricopeptide (TPR) repeat protein
VVLAFVAVAAGGADEPGASLGRPEPLVAPWSASPVPRPASRAGPNLAAPAEPKPITPALFDPPEEAPPPRKLNPPATPETERNLLLGAARNAVRLRNWDTAVSRFEEYFRRFGRDDVELRKEFAGVLVQAGRLRQAFGEYQDLLNSRPADAEVRTALADLAVRMKDYRQAVGLLAPALQRDPGNFDLAIRLARTFVFDDDFPKALQIYDQYLAKLRPGDARVPLALPALLIDMERPAEALAFLQPLLARLPANPELLAILVRIRAYQGDRAGALEVVGELAEKATENLRVRLDLGETLYSSEEFEVAAAVFNQVLQADPGNAEALIDLARVWIQQYQPNPARTLLQAFKQTAAQQRRYLQARAEYHQLVGEYADARQIYERLLREDPNEHESRLSLGDLYQEPLREDERAKAEYAKIPPTAPQYRRAQAGIAAALTNQRLFADAVAVCKTLLAEYPSDGNGVAQWSRTLDKAGHLDEAIALCRSFLEANPRNPSAVRTVRLALGKVLLDAHRRQEAVQEYEQVLALPRGRIPPTLYGLARAAEGEGNPDKARQILAASGPPQENPRYWIILADLFSADADDRGALEMAQMVLKTSPDNLAALIRAVTAQSRLARQSGNAAETAGTAQLILTLSPNNVRARLEMARALASAQRFAESIEAYEGLIAIDPTARLPRRERARMLQANNQFAAAQAAYAELLSTSAPEHVPTPSTSHLPLDLGSQLLAAQLGGTLATAPQPEPALQRNFLDDQARAAEQAVDQLESQVKDRDWRHWALIPPANELLHREPSNTSVLFDLAQDYGNLRWTHKAMDTFAEGLRADPHERESAIGLERAGLELAPQGILGFDFFNQIGRQGLARISRFYYSNFVRIPYGDEDEYVSAGFTRADYVPRDDHSLQGNILSGGFQAKYQDRLYLSGLVNLEDYPERLDTRVTFDTQLRYDFCDAVRGRVGMYLNNVIENGETLRQDIYRYGARAGTDLFLSRSWSAFATYTYGHYSDHNDLNELFLRTDYIFCFPPSEWKAIVTMDLQNFRASTVFRPDDPADINGIVHPYFSPRLYVYYEGRLSWKKWLSRDYFTYANQCWVNLEYGIGWDNNLNNYNTLRTRFNADIKPWLSIGADAQVILSPVYNAEQVTAYLILRWPGYGR